MYIIGMAAIAFVSVVVLSLILTIPTWLLWNWLCPDLFGLPVIDFWQAMGLSLLCSFLFKSNSSSKSE